MNATPTKDSKVSNIHGLQPNLACIAKESGENIVEQMKNYFLMEANHQTVSDSTAAFVTRDGIKQCNRIHNNAYFARSVKKHLKNRYFILRHGESEANRADVISSNPNVATKIHGLTELGKEQAMSAAPSFLSMLISGSDSKPPPNRSNANESKFYINIISSDFTRAKETAEVFRECLIRHLKKEVVVLDTGSKRSNDTGRDDRLGLYPLENIVLEPTIVFDKRLRERWFGTLDGASESKTQYEKVWLEDALEDELSVYLEGVQKIIVKGNANLEKSKKFVHNLSPNNGIISPKSSFCVESLHHVRQRACDLIEEKEGIDKNDSDNSDSTKHPGNNIYVFVAHGDTLQILQTAFAPEIDFDARKHRSLPHLGNAEVREMRLFNSNVKD